MNQQQQGVPTVGDTIVVTHRIAVPAGSAVEARPLADSSIATLVSPPVVTREADSVTISYTLAVWAPGQNTVVLPGAVVIDPRGVVDTLADANIPISVASLLPSGKAPASISPKAARPWFPHVDRSTLPFVTLVPAAIIVVLLGQWWWRRRGPRYVMAPVVRPSIGDPRLRLRQWIAAGESRLALDHLEALVRDRTDFAEWRQRADALRFAPAQGGGIDALVREGLDRLDQDAP